MANKTLFQIVVEKFTEGLEFFFRKIVQGTEWGGGVRLERDFVIKSRWGGRVPFLRSWKREAKSAYSGGKAGAVFSSTEFRDKECSD